MQQQKLLETLVLPPGAPPINQILNAEVSGYIKAYPLSEQTRGYIRKATRIILPPEVQVELNNGENILKWVLFQYCVVNGITEGKPFNYRCDGQCQEILRGQRCNHRDNGSGYTCSLIRGHAGDHIGCHGGSYAENHNNQRWPNTITAVPMPDLTAAMPDLTAAINAMAALTAQAPPPPDTDDEGEVSVHVRYQERVTGSYSRYDQRECTVTVPRYITHDIDAVRQYIQDTIENGDQTDDTRIETGDDDMDENTSEFNDLLSSNTDLREQIND